MLVYLANLDKFMKLVSNSRLRSKKGRPAKSLVCWASGGGRAGTKMQNE